MFFSYLSYFLFLAQFEYDLVKFITFDIILLVLMVMIGSSIFNIIFLKELDQRRFLSKYDYFIDVLEAKYNKNNNKKQISMARLCVNCFYICILSTFL